MNWIYRFAAPGIKGFQRRPWNFAAKIFGSKGIIGTYYGFLNYEKLFVGTRSRPAVYIEGLMAVESEDFCQVEYAVERTGGILTYYVGSTPHLFVPCDSLTMSGTQITRRNIQQTLI